MSNGKRVVAVGARMKRRQPIPVIPPRVPTPRQQVTDGAALVRLDPELLTMIRGYIAHVRTVYPDLWDVPSWDHPWCHTPPVSSVAECAELCHAIGLLAGVAATLDLTPMEMIDQLA